MQGASRSALAHVRSELGRRLSEGADAADTSRELFAAVDVLDGNAGLRRALTDSTHDASSRAGLVDTVFGGKVGDPVLALLREVSSQRWTKDRDASDAVEELAVASAFAAADRRGRIDEVEEQLFRFERTVAGSADLRDAFMDRQRAGADKASLVHALLDGKAEPETAFLAARGAEHPRGRRYERVLEDYLRVAASVRQQLTAIVTVATPLTPEQRDRLARALHNLYGREVMTNVVIDPEVVGGVRVQVGDEVIDGTILSRLENVRRDMAG
ncbi:ATP synthase F1 subcomplex delta subunit [Yimella lutea]|uniref:ATP synthase subunit delta n=1 Tax=Yimella lutea TaxID=587872 RepID=A0A542EEZ8_9MICO|nr:F0F1 ATP synthase subunit delta [Yimella lutea]TQJ13918.1 ATP synthase F1 subcomplex delta subunit [Yimella lutea]